MIIPDFKIDRFFGINTNIKDKKTLKPGYSPDSLNWLTSGKDGDHIELRRGYAILGQTRNTDANGKVTGLGVGAKYDGVQTPFYSHGRKVKYYDVITDDTIEVGSDLIAASASGDDFWFNSYQNLAGSFMYLGSANSTTYKIPVANPGSAVDQVTTDFRFNVLKFGRGRSFAGDRKGTTAGNQDKTGLYLSYIDKALLSAYTQVTGEAYGIGNGVLVTFAKTATVIGAGKTIMYPSITDGTETFIDDRNGNLIGNLGGTGTINYATGAMSVTFNTAPTNLQAITCSYYHETATSAGVLDFSGSGNGQGKVYRQDDAGNFMATFDLNTIEYCFHKLKTYQLSVSLDDTVSTNLPYRNVGIPYSRAAYFTPEGLLFADLARPTEPKFRVLEVLQGTTSTTIEPTSISDALDLAPFSFDYCVAFRWGDYRVFCIQNKTNAVADTFNSVMWVQNVLSGAWSKLNYYASCLAEYSGTLIAGDSISNNLTTLFSGYDDDGDVIENYWISTDLDLKTNHLKTCRRMILSGLIQKEQSFEVHISLDGGAFSLFETITGNGTYVDTGINTYIGASTVGSKVVGGGGSDTAHPYELDFKINTDKFKYITVKLVALKIGYISVNLMEFKDIRDKGMKNIPSRTS